jgi:hypothetical protein
MLKEIILSNDLINNIESYPLDGFYYVNNSILLISCRFAGVVFWVCECSKERAEEHVRSICGFNDLFKKRMSEQPIIFSEKQSGITEDFVLNLSERIIKSMK